MAYLDNVTIINPFDPIYTEVAKAVLREYDHHVYGSLWEYPYKIEFVNKSLSKGIAEGAGPNNCWISIQPWQLSTFELIAHGIFHSALWRFYRNGRFAVNACHYAANAKWYTLAEKRLSRWRLQKTKLYHYDFVKVWKNAFKIDAEIKAGTAPRGRDKYVI